MSLPQCTTPLEEILDVALHTLTHNDLAIWERELKSYSQHERRYRAERRFRTFFAAVVNHVEGMCRRPNRRHAS